MKNLKRITVFSIIFCVTGLTKLFAGGGIEFEHTSWEAVKAKALKSGKYIFVDFYATWCGPCKTMSRDVFTASEVGSYFQKNFISYKVNAETEELGLVELTKIEAYPTLVFYDPNGEEVIRQVGGLNAFELIEKAKKAINAKTIEEKVKSGSYTDQEYSDYLEIVKTKDPLKAQKLALEWLDNKKLDLTIHNQWNMLAQFVSIPPDNYLSQIKEQADILFYVHEDFVYYASDVIGSISEQALLNEDMGLVKKAVDLEYQILEKLGSADYDYNYYELSKTYKFYYHLNRYEEYIATLDNWLVKYKNNDWSELADNAFKVAEDKNSTKAHLATAKIWAENALKLDNNFMTNMVISRVYFNQADYQSAMKYLKVSKNFEEALEYYDFIAEYEEELIAFL